MALFGVLLGLLLLVLPRTTPAWWLLSGMEMASLGAMEGRCGLLPGLSRSQRLICLRHPDAMDAVVEGLAMAIENCESQFRSQRWNCSALQGAGFGLAPLKVASRESAFVFAISSAGVAHALARACAAGTVAACTCGAYPPPNSPHSSPYMDNYYWAGCSDNVRYGNQFSRQFFDLNEKQRGDARALMNLHNNRVGRRLMASNMRKQCKCHGVSGSCVTQTCWKVVPKFDRFAGLLRRKYDDALMVTVGQGQPGSSPDRLLALTTTVAVNNASRSQRYLVTPMNAVSKSELVYLDLSPDYCSVDRERGIQGTRGRECGGSGEKEMKNNCGELCCNRGFDTYRQMVEEPCKCRFIWCCQVKCATCRRAVDRHYCR